MAQHPKFIISEDSNGAITWRAEKDNGEVTGTSGEATFNNKGQAEDAIKDHVLTTIGAAGVSISLGTDFQPIIDYEGFEEALSEPGLDDVTSEEVVEESP
jgi:hypothetical protein